MSDTYIKIDRFVMKRHHGNPILTVSAFPVKMRAVYNSSAVKTPDGKYVMLCRVNQLNHQTLLWGADSEDGATFTPRPEPYRMPETAEWKYFAPCYYDPRITWIDGEFKVLLACQSAAGTRVAMFRSADLGELKFQCWINQPDNRNMVLFPEKAPDGRYVRLERPNVADKGGKGNIWASYSPDLLHWGDSHEVLKTTDCYNYAFSGLGPSTVPMRIDEGWLMFFHGIMDNCTSREYSMGAAILDANAPHKVLHHTKHPLLFPEADYEMTGLVEHVVFPCSSILEDDGEVRVYYGAADTVQCMASGRLEDIIHACKNW